MIMRSATLTSQTARDSVCPETQKLEIGLMLYTARELFEKDLNEGLEFIASQGFENVELISLTDHPMVPDPYFGHTAEDYRQIILRSGLNPVSAHCNPMAEIEPQLDVANLMGVEYLVFPIAPAFMEMTSSGPRLKDVLEPSDCDELVEMLNRIGASCKKQGIQLAYHNHHAEFIPNKGVMPYDLIISRTDPELVSMELDVGWVAKAGLDPADVLKKSPGRFALCHLKDYDPTLPNTGMGEEFVAPGDGVLDFTGILEAAELAGVRYGFVECDYPVNTRELIEQAARQLLSPPNV